MAEVELAAETYRRIDRASKVVAVVAVAAGLELGGDTPAGLLLGAIGVALALSTVFIRNQP
ncbi:hypothetical protein [Halomarina pelagica]|uniref:hypothetical protein n=1 Tax=Halomarina pelagica TaxID=2961599 RepID=UPI0020C40E21|nr:hypothetical protein [Halomarina sp. BND7]